MIRIYMDWNLFSILKKPTHQPHLILKEFLEENSDQTQLVYSPAHLDDLSETNKEHKKKLENDLIHLSTLTQDNCIVRYWGSENVVLHSRNPTEFFNTNLDDNSGFVIKSLDRLRRIITDEYGYVRDKVIQPLLNIDVTKICNFSIPKLDEMISLAGLSDSLDNFLKKGIELNASKAEKLSYIDYYYTAYTSLDLISFYPDSMKEKGNFENLKNDAHHSAYGSLCDAFITNDNKCYNKSKFLFSYFGSNSSLVKTCRIENLKELERQLNDLLEK